MPRKAKELSALQVGRLKTPGLYFVGGATGLALQVAEGGARTWVLRATIGGKRRDMGLGSFGDVDLSTAREKARAARVVIDQGSDPILQRREAKSQLAAAAAAAKTFAECTRLYLDAKSPGWKNTKHSAQWPATIEQYASPVIGRVLVRDVSLAHILAILEPIWQTKTETASRLRGRLERILSWATVRGYRTGENPARWRGHLDMLLAAPSKVAKVRHHPALPVSEMPSFITALRAENGIAARALEFVILTAARSGEVRGASWHEIDLEHGVWVVPGVRMKAGRDHRVPLSAAAISLLKSVQLDPTVDLVFPSPRGGQLSDMTLNAVMRRMKAPAVPHGFRSTFKDWATEHTEFPGEMSEMALAHAISDKTEAAYRRGDLFERRRKMMSDWAAHCGYKAGTAKSRGRVSQSK